MKLYTSIVALYHTHYDRLTLFLFLKWLNLKIGKNYYFKVLDDLLPYGNNPPGAAGALIVDLS